MSAFAQPRTLTPTSSPLHFPLSSPPLHIPPSLQSLETPDSKGFTFGLIRHSRDRTRQSVGYEDRAMHQSPAEGGSRRGSLSSVESLPFGTLSHPYNAAEFEQTKPTSVHRTTSLRGSTGRPLTSANLFLHRSSSMLSLTLEDEGHHLPELSRANSVSTCASSSSRGMAPITPHYSPYDSDIQVLSEEEEDTEENSLSAFPTSKPLPTSSHVIIHTRPPPALKRPGLIRRDTPIPARDLAMTEPMRHPSKAFTTTLTPTPTPAPSPVPREELVAQAAAKPKRPPFKRRGTPHPFPMAGASVVPFTAFAPADTATVDRPETTTVTRTTKMPNFFSPSLKRSLRLSGGVKRLTLTTSDDEDDNSSSSSTTTTREAAAAAAAASPSSSFGSSPSFTSYAHSPPISSSMMTLPLDERMMWPLSPESLKADDDDDDDGAFIVGSPEMALEMRTFSSVLDGKVWVSV